MTDNKPKYRGVNFKYDDREYIEQVTQLLNKVRRGNAKAPQMILQAVRQLELELREEAKNVAA